jgi:sigma-B regulation protein RsbU (phosphoserine phosphatase)
VSDDESGKDSSGVQILVVDDNPSFRCLLVSTLRKLGYDVAEAEDGGEAWKMYQQSDVPIMICDYMMPEIDGLELCRRIRAVGRPRYTYIILLTGMSGKEHFLAGMEAGADDFIVKPFDREQLHARIRVAERILSLQAENAELKQLLPMCSYCRKIRDDQQYWQTLEHYLQDHAGAQFSHGICPGCWKDHVEPKMGIPYPTR